MNIKLALLLSLTLACSGSDQVHEDDGLWASYRRTTATTSELLLLYEDGAYLIIYTPSAPTAEGMLGETLRAQLITLLAPERTEPYRSDSVLLAATERCEPTATSPLRTSLLWEMTSFSASAGYGCWDGTQSAATQTLIDAFNAMLDAPR